jgi:hypothetical protein
MAYPDEVDRVLKNLGDAIFEGRRLTVEKVNRHLLRWRKFAHLERLFRL